VQFLMPNHKLWRHSVLGTFATNINYWQSLVSFGKFVAEETSLCSVIQIIDLPSS